MKKVSRRGCIIVGKAGKHYLGQIIKFCIITSKPYLWYVPFYISGGKKGKVFINPTTPSSSCHLWLGWVGRMQRPERKCQQQRVQKSLPLHTPELLPPNTHETGPVFSNSLFTMFLTALQEASHPRGSVSWSDLLGSQAGQEQCTGLTDLGMHVCRGHRCWEWHLTSVVQKSITWV